MRNSTLAFATLPWVPVIHWDLTKRHSQATAFRLSSHKNILLLCTYVQAWAEVERPRLRAKERLRGRTAALLSCAAHSMRECPEWRHTSHSEPWSVHFCSRLYISCNKTHWLVERVMTSPRSLDSQWTNQRAVPNLKLPKNPKTWQVAHPRIWQNSLIGQEGDDIKVTWPPVDQSEGSTKF